VSRSMFKKGHVAARTLITLLTFTALTAKAQLQPAPALPKLDSVDALLKLKGSTINMSVQDGSRSSLNFGSSTSMGVSVNMTASDGTKTSASSTLAPSKGTIEFSIGKGATLGETTADINNLRTEKSGTTDKSYGAQGQAKLTGVTSVLNIELDPTKTGFSAQTETLHKVGTMVGLDGPKDSKGDYVVKPFYVHGEQLNPGSENSSASATSNINSATNVDINTTTFTNVFMQAF